MKKKLYKFIHSMLHFNVGKKLLHGVGLFANDVIQTFLNDRTFPS